MYAACSFAVGQVTGVTGITGFAQVWTWIAFTVTLVVLAGLLRRARYVWRRPDTEEPAERPGRALSRSGSAFWCYPVREARPCPSLCPGSWVFVVASTVSLTLVPGGVRARRR